MFARSDSQSGNNECKSRYDGEVVLYVTLLKKKSKASSKMLCLSCTEGLGEWYLRNVFPDTMRFKKKNEMDS